MRSEAFKLEETIIKQYKKEKMEEVYGLSYADFMETGKIKRYVYEMIVDLNITFENENRESRQPKKNSHSTTEVSGITKHLIQIESFFNPYSNIEEFFLTDVDFIMKGNSFFREKLTS